MDFELIVQKFNYDDDKRKKMIYNVLISAKRRIYMSDKIIKVGVVGLGRGTAVASRYSLASRSSFQS